MKYDDADSYAILSYGAITTQYGVLAPETIFDHLFGSAYWYTIRRSNVLKSGTNLLFYERANGVRAAATVGEVIAQKVTTLLQTPVIPYFTQKLTLHNQKYFARPIAIRPIVEQLDFVSDKRNWGLALRSTPRSISKKDFDLILKLGLSTL